MTILVNRSPGDSILPLPEPTEPRISILTPCWRAPLTMSGHRAYAYSQGAGLYALFCLMEHTWQFAAVQIGG